MSEVTRQKIDCGEEWLPASKAVERAQKAGYSMSVSWLSRIRAHLSILIRPAALPGRHKKEVEWRSLIAYLVEHKSKDGGLQPEQDEGCDREAIERRMQEESARKHRTRG
jgi:hypothetical protein